MESRFLILSLIFFASCSGQEKSTTNIINSNTKLKSDSSLQIDQYVVEIFEDRKGNLWFGTMAKGVACSGEKTLTYLSVKDGLVDNTVVSIAQDKEGNMWFGTHAGASKYDGKTFTNFTEAKGLHGAGCFILVDKSGNIWAGTNHGAFRFNGTSFTEFKIPNPVIENPSYKWEAGKVWSMMEDKKGNIWFARDGFGACKFDGTTFTHFTKKDGLCSNNVSSIVEDKEGNIWFGSLTSDFPESIKEGGVSRYDGKTFTRYPEIKGLDKNDIYTIYADKKGNIWIGATGYGAYRYDTSASVDERDSTLVDERSRITLINQSRITLSASGKNFTLYQETDRQDLTVNFGVQAILEDRNGTLWFGFSGGLFRFNGKSFINVTQDGPWQQKLN